MARPKSPFDNFNQNARRTTPRGHDPHRELWETWNENNRHPDHLEPLLDALEPTIQGHAKRKLKGLGGSIPYSALEQQLRIAAKKGLESYKPESGTKVKTWVISNFQRITDDVAKWRNFAQIPKPRVELYQRFMNAKNEFVSQHGHEPTAADLRQKLPDVPEKDLKNLLREVRREHFIGGNPDPDARDDSSLGHAPSQVRSIISLMPALLTPDEQRVFDHLFPSMGEPQTVAQIARKVGLNQNQVYRIRSSIYKKVKPHLGGI